MSKKHSSPTMQKSYTILDNHTFTYEWEITNFKSYAEFLNNVNQSYILLSSQFSPNKNSEDQFHLELEFNFTCVTSAVKTDNRSQSRKNGSSFGHRYSPCGDYYDDLYNEQGKIRSQVEKSREKWLSYMICWDKCNPLQKLQFQLYLLNDKKEKHGMKDIIGQVNVNRVGFAEFITLSDLLNKAELLLPNSTLSLGCDMIVFDEPVNISSTYLRKSNGSLARQLKKVLASQNGSDFTFIVDNKKFNVHKFMLVARSPVFKTMFENEMIEKKTGQATIVDIRADIFKLMIEYIYTDKVEVDLIQNDASDLLAAADKYELEGLKDFCSEYLHKLLQVENAMDILLLADQYGIEQLSTCVKNFIKVNEQKILNTLDAEYFIKYPNHASIFIFKL